MKNPLSSRSERKLHNSVPSEVFLRGEGARNVLCEGECPTAERHSLKIIGIPIQAYREEGPSQDVTWPA